MSFVKYINEKKEVEVPLIETEITAVDILARELFKVKNKDGDIYKRIHKLMMTNDVKNAKKGLELIKKFKYSLNEASAEESLRKANFKIKSVHGTKFGTEFVMAKQYKEDEITDVLKNYTVKFDGKSIFVID